MPITLDGQVPLACDYVDHAFKTKSDRFQIRFAANRWRDMPQFPMELVVPCSTYLDGYRVALTKGWSPNNLQDVSKEELRIIEQNPQLVFDLADNPTGSGPLVELTDGSFVPRLPSIARWLWDGEFCGTIKLRWNPDSAELPAHVLGHIGYAVVPWKRNLGYATAALKAILPEARKLGLPYVELTTDPENRASQIVVEKNGGTLIEEFVKPESQGGTPGYLWRIFLT